MANVKRETQDARRRKGSGGASEVERTNGAQDIFRSVVDWHPHSALGTQHSALSTQHAALDPQSSSASVDLGPGGPRDD